MFCQIRRSTCMFKYVSIILLIYIYYYYYYYYYYC